MTTTRDGSEPSTAWTAAEKLPAEAGTPAIVPADDSVSPGGNAPDATDQTTVPTWPLVDPVSCYGTPTWPFGAGGIVALNGGGLTTSVSDADAVFADQLASVARTVNANVPAAVGVPLIDPFAFSVTPAGKAPPVIVHVVAPLPPVAASTD